MGNQPASGPQLVSWLPPILYGPDAVPGTVHLGWHTVDRLEGFHVKAVLEKNLPEEQQSARTLSYFANMISPSYQFWMGPYLQYRKVGRGWRFLIRFVENHCIPWLLNNCWNNAVAPLQPLRPILRPGKSEEALRKVLHAYPTQGCPQKYKMMSRGQAERILGVGYAVNVDKLYNAYRKKLMAVDVRNAPPDAREEAEELEQMIEEAFTTILAYRFVTPPGKAVEDRYNRMTPQQVGVFQSKVQYIVYKRAEKRLYKDIREASARGEEAPSLSQGEIEARVHQIKQEILRKRGLDGLDIPLVVRMTW